MLDIRIKHACPSTAVACRTMGTTLGQRIREAREARGWSQLRLGESVGVSRAAVSQWESGESKGLRPENLVAAARALAVNVEWLVTGVGAMRPDELATGEGRSDFPLIDWSTAARWPDVGRNAYRVGAEEWLPSPVPLGPAAFVLRVRGCSMAPRLLEGELVYIDPDRPPVHGGIVLVLPGGATEPVLRELIVEGDRRVLRASNPDWPDPLRALSGLDTLIGSVAARLERF